MLRKFRVTVNGNTYDVDVEELGGAVSAAPVTAVQQTAAPAAAPVQAAAAPAAAPAAAAGVGATKVEAPMQGKIVSVKVSEGQQVEEGDVVAVLEAMKMENEIVASAAGTVASVNVAAGQSVEAGDLIASLN